MNASIILILDLIKLLNVLIAGLAVLVLLKLWRDPDPELTERFRWRMSALITYVAALLIGTVLFMSGCKRKATQPATNPIPFDSTRHQLEQQATGSHNQVIISQGQAQQTRTPYEQSISRFDSIPVALP